MRGWSAQAPFWSLPVIYPLVFDGSIGSPPPCWQESGAGEWFAREIPAPRPPLLARGGGGLPGMLRHTGQCKWLPEEFKDPERPERSGRGSSASAPVPGARAHVLLSVLGVVNDGSKGKRQAWQSPGMHWGKSAYRACRITYTQTVKVV